MMFGIVAKDPGENRGLKLLHSTGFHPTAEAAIEAAAKRLQGDHRFKKRWGGKQLLPVVMDFFLKVEPNGIVILHKNERDQRRG